MEVIDEQNEVKSLGLKQSGQNFHSRRRSKDIFKKNALNALNPTVGAHGGVNEDFESFDMSNKIGRRADGDETGDQSDEPLGNVREELLHPDFNITVGEAAAEIERQLQTQEKSDIKYVRIPGLGYERCPFKRIKDEQEAKKKPKK